MAKKKDDARNHKIFFRMNDKEYLKYLNNLELSKVGASDFIRQSVLVQPVTEKKDDIIDGLNDCKKQLYKMGNNVNQISKWLNAYRIECNLLQKNLDIDKAEPYLNQLEDIRKNIREVFNEMNLCFNYYYSDEE